MTVTPTWGSARGFTQSVGLSEEARSLLRADDPPPCRYAVCVNILRGASLILSDAFCGAGGAWSLGSVCAKTWPLLRAFYIF